MNDSTLWMWCGHTISVLATSGSAGIFVLVAQAERHSALSVESVSHGKALDNYCISGACASAISR